MGDETTAVGTWQLGRLEAPHRHVRTRKKAPWTNRMMERFFEATQYERLYLHDIADGLDLAAHVDDFQTIYSQIRPQEAIAMTRPLDSYRQTPQPNLPDHESVSDP